MTHFHACDLRPCNGVGRRIASAAGLVAEDITLPEDQEFIRHAREDVPALVAEVEALLTVISVISDVYAYASDLADGEPAMENVAKALKPFLASDGGAA